MRLAVLDEISSRLGARVRRVELASGPVVIYAGSRGCTIEAINRITAVRDRSELNELIDALMDLREQLIEEVRDA